MSWDTLALLPRRENVVPYAERRNEPTVAEGLADVLDLAELYAVDSHKEPMEGFTVAGGDEAGPTTDTQGNYTARSPVVRRFPRTRVRASGLEVAQHWEGVVTEVHRDHFVAILKNADDPNNPKRFQARFNLSEAEDAGDLDLVAPGAVFTWTIGKIHTPYPHGADFVKFLRLPMWTKSDLERIRLRAAELRKKLFGDSADASNRQTGS